MRNYGKLIWTIFFVGMIVFVPKTQFAQKKASYNMDFLRAVQFKTGERNHILTIFKVTPTIKKFKLILSMKVTYEIGQQEKVEDVHPALRIAAERYGSGDNKIISIIDRVKRFFFNFVASQIVIP
ncbi:MAG: hypothetical protein NTW10_02715 [Bacteroidetes bacterium]|nr:hypothetical protein [Bacteroidota bacterium]